MAKKLTEQKEEQPIQQNLVIISYAHFDSFLYHHAITALSHSIGGFMLTRSQQSYKKNNVRSLIELKGLEDFHIVKKNFKEYFLLQKILYISKQYYNAYQNNKSQLLKQYGKFDKETNQHVLFEDEKTEKFNEEFKKLLDINVQIDISKLSSDVLFHSWQDLNERWEKVINNEAQQAIFRKGKDKFASLFFFEFINNIFDIEDIFSWSYDKEVDKVYDNIFK